MKKHPIFPIVLIIVSLQALSAQLQRVKGLPEFEEEIAVLAHTVVNDTALSERLKASEGLTFSIQQALKLPNAFSYNFEKVKGVSMLAPEDGAFRLFSWQVFINDSTYKYEGLFVNPSGKVFSLKNTSREMAKPATATGSDKRWYGCLYYKIVPFKKDKKNDAYVVLGYESYDFFTRRKIMDVLTIENGKPKFSSPLIEYKAANGKMKTCNRYIMEYSAAAAVRLNYDPEFEMIVFDNLIMGPGGQYVPDGSYSGFKLDKGKWKFEETLFKDAPVLKDGEAPVPSPKGQDGLFRPR
jgi:hypothetical protein